MAGVAHGAALMPSRSVGRTFVLLVAGIVVLAVASRLSLLLHPVPVTGQTLAVTAIGALYGWRLGAATVVAWLALAMAGAPFLVDGASGFARFTGPTGGYLFAFPLAAALVGALGSVGWHDRLATSLVAMAAGNALCLIVGTAWLAASIGIGAALLKGAIPFLPGALLKSTIGALIVRIVRRG